MGRAKEVKLRVIPSKIAVPFVKKHHYSGKVVVNSNLHFGAFLDGKLHGVMSFGSSTDKSRIITLVKGTKWNEFMELNRMAFDDYLPKNSESRCISQAIKLIKKNAPNIKWIISFADGCSCGDGTIYRASNFLLTGIKRNVAIYELPNGEKIHKLTLFTVPNKRRAELGGKSFYDITRGISSFKKYLEYSGAKPLDGYQLRYIYFIDKSYKDKLTVPILPFSEIDKLNARMYKGEKLDVRV